MNKNFLALSFYQISLGILQDELKMLLQSGNVSLAAEIKIQQSKLLTNCSLMLITATKSNHKRVDLDEHINRKQLIFHNEEVYPFEIPKSLIAAINFSLGAITLNACWRKNYDRVNKAIEELKQYFENEQNKMEFMDSEGSCDVAIKKLIDIEKKNNRIVEIWGSKCDYYPAASTVEGFPGHLECSSDNLAEKFSLKVLKNL